MKKILLPLIIVAALVIYGCNKTGDTPPINNLTGTWKYVGYSGGIAGLSFQPVNNVEAYVQVDTAGTRVMATYSNQQGCATFTAKPCFFCCTTSAVSLADTVTLSNTIPLGTDNQLFVSIVHDTLMVSPLLTNCNDCTIAYYVPSSKQLAWCADTTATK